MTACLSLNPANFDHSAHPGHAGVRTLEHAAARGRVTVEYVMIAGVNVGPEDAAALGKLFRDIPIRLNPIAVNDPSGEHRPPTESEWNAFRDALARELPGQPIVRRYSSGQDEHAACGMLKLRPRTDG